MAVLSALGDGWQFVKEAFHVLRKRKILIVPLFISWTVIASLVLYLKWYATLPSGLPMVVFYIFGFILAISVIIGFANLIMLELIEQIEEDEKVSIMGATKEAVGRDFLKMIPIALIWAAVWTFLLILDAITSKFRRGKSEPSARNAARTLAGADSPFSLLSLGIDLLKKVVRMSIFLALPSIAWENKGPISSLRTAKDVIKQHAEQFFGIYSMTWFTVLLMGLPLVPVFLLDEMGYAFPSIFWMAVIVYEGTVWTLNMYLEQMTVGMLHLWHLKWVRNGREGDIDSVPKPSLLDEVYELDQEVKSSKEAPPDIKNWIQEQYRRGYTKEQIKESLRKSGRDPNLVDKVLS